MLVWECQLSRIVLIPDKDIGISRNYQKHHTPIQRFGMLVKACMKKTDHSNPVKDDGSGGIEDEDHEYDKKKN